MGLTDLGYIRRTYDDILNDKIQKAKELFGEDIDTSDLTALGKFIRINAYDQALMEEELEAVYYARFPDTASGQSLDRLMTFVGIARNPAVEAQYSVKVTGEAGATVPVGFLVSTDTDLTFYCVEETTIGEAGTCEIVVSCTEAGTVGNVNAGAITRITNPDVNIAAVAGLTRLVGGEDVESDTALRARFKAAIQGYGNGNETSLRSALLRVPTVQYAAVVENNTATEDSDGRPPHSFECYVRGGESYEQEIGEAIFSKKPLGIRTVGDKAVTVKDSSGNDQTVYYSPTENVGITVKIALKAVNTFPADGADQIKAAVSDYIDGLGIGKSLILSSIYGHIYGVAGVTEVTTLELSTDGGSTFSAANVEVSKYSLAVCDSVQLTVEVMT